MKGKKKINNPVRISPSTRGREIIRTQYNDLILRDDFQDLIKSLRAEYNVRVVYDKEIEKFRFANAEFLQEYNLIFFNKVKPFADDNNLIYPDFVDVVEYYIFNNEIPKTFVYENAYDLCIVEDLNDKKGKEHNKFWQESDDLRYPVSIRINPNVGIKMLVDYIEKNFKTHIEPRQKRYLNEKTIIKKLRKRKNEDRDRYIIVHKNGRMSRLINHIKKKWGQDLDELQIKDIIRRKSRH